MTKRKIQYWVIPPKASSEFVAEHLAVGAEILAGNAIRDGRVDSGKRIVEPGAECPPLIVGDVGDRLVCVVAVHHMCGTFSGMA